MLVLNNFEVLNKLHNLWNDHILACILILKNVLIGISCQK